MTWNKLLSSLSRILVASTVLGAFLQSVTRGVARAKKLTRKWSVVVLPPQHFEIKDAKRCILMQFEMMFLEVELLRKN